jgi:hypothetical protein
MSMKRTRQKSYRGRDKDVPTAGVKSNSPPEKTWEELVGSQPEDQFVVYAMQQKFAKGALLNHATFGKGVVTAVEDSRIEVLFSAGKKKLGHGIASLPPQPPPPPPSDT